jgi:hypothetical protein
MHIIQIFLPLRDNDKNLFSPKLFSKVKTELIDKFDGLTAFVQSPAQGLWVDDDGISKDEIVILEVMSEGLDRKWWANYRLTLEKRFEQEKVIIRSCVAELM